LEADGQRFGVVFYTEAGATESEQVGQLELEDASLPIVARPVAQVEHLGVPQPLRPQGTIACWATSSGGRCEGWLTARHVASALGCRMVDCGRECIDAAVIETSDGCRGEPSKAVMPSVGGRVEVLSEQPIQARILDVATNFKVVHSSYFPLRFTTSTPGREGDSGSLVMADPCGEPVGIYLGAINPERRGRWAGFALAITQLEALMNLEVYI
jgi:hypothetical protein